MQAIDSADTFDGLFCECHRSCCAPFVELTAEIEIGHHGQRLCIACERDIVDIPAEGVSLVCCRGPLFVARTDSDLGVGVDCCTGEFDFHREPCVVTVDFGSFDGNVKSLDVFAVLNDNNEFGFIPNAGTLFLRAVVKAEFDVGAGGNSLDLRENEACIVACETEFEVVLLEICASPRVTG